jgi:hypothetical protein
MAFLKAGLVQVCARPPSPGSEPFYSKTMHKYKKLHNFEVEPLGVCSIFLKDICHGCMHAIRSFIWLKRLNKITNITLKKLSISFKDNCHSEK